LEDCVNSDNRHEVVVITGASAGVGRAATREFARRGASIGIIARDPDRLQQTKTEVERLGGRALALPLDVADADKVDEAASQVEQEFGPIDIWVNNAMVTVFSPVKDMAADEYRRVTEVTYLGVVNGTLAALHRMLPRDHGKIVQVGSALAYRAIPLQSAYCGAKHAIQGFTESLRSELYHDKSNVSVTMVQMPALNTPQFDWTRNHLSNKPQPVPPIFEPEVAGEAIYWAAHHDRPEIYVGMPTEKAIWGNRVMPRLLDHYLANNGFKSQITNEPDDPNRPNNLYEPVKGDFEARGRFSDKAKPSSPQLWATLHRGPIAIGAGIAAAAGLALFGFRNGSGGK
jgi:short-subunit dehydrogenase